MSSLNKPLSKQFKEEYEIIEKGLATKEEINRLKKHSNHKEWLAKWWIPINWCCDMVRAQCSKEGREYCQRHYQIQNTVRINHSGSCFWVGRLAKRADRLTDRKFKLSVES